MVTAIRVLGPRSFEVHAGSFTAGRLAACVALVLACWPPLLQAGDRKGPEPKGLKGAEPLKGLEEALAKAAAGGGGGVLCSACLTGRVGCLDPALGSLGPGDCVFADGSFFDVYSFELESAQLVQLTLLSRSFDPYLFLLNESCQLIADNDDCTQGDFTLACLVLPLAPGTYYVVVNSYAGGETGNYALEIECRDNQLCTGCTGGSLSCGSTAAGTLAPQDCRLMAGQAVFFVDVFRLALPEAMTARIRLSTGGAFDPVLFLLDASCSLVARNDDCAGDLTVSCLTLNLAAGDYYVVVTSYGAGEMGAYSLSVTCENLCADCQALDVWCGATVQGSLSSGDCRLPEDDSFIDLYRLEMRRTAEVTLRMSSPAIDCFLILFNGDCTVRAFNDDCSAEDLNSCLTLELEPGTYFIGANSFDPGEVGPYTLEVSCPGVSACEDCRQGEIRCGDALGRDFPASGCRSREGRPIDIFELELTAASSIVLRLEATAFDPVLSLFDAACAQLASNDDCNMTSLDSCLRLDLAAGRYFVGVSSAFPEEAGGYTLSLSCGGRRQLPGDCNQDGRTNISDAICLFGFLFLGSPSRLPCGNGLREHPGNLALLNWNGDGRTDLSDGIGLLNHLFSGGPPHVLGGECRALEGCPEACQAP